MDTTTIATWVQLAIWLFAFVVYIVRLLKGEARMPHWIQQHVSLNVVLAVLIAIGILGNAVVLILDYRERHFLEDVSVSAYPAPGVSQNLAVVSNETFENENVPLDGRIFDHCTFVNVCLLYDGGAYQIQHSTFRDNWRVCVKEPALKNYSELALAMHLFRPETRRSGKSVLSDTQKQAALAPK
jgi:hypothetical protein